MIRRPPRSTRTDTLLAYTTLFRVRVVQLVMNSTSADPPGGLQPFRPTGKLRHERPQCRLKVLQDRPAETVDRLRPHSRVGLDARDYLENGRAHACTPVTNAHLVCRLLLEINNTKKHTIIMRR